ncbi:MAG: hypothetical protein U9R26_09230 [Campylobacterota bacterium]|nr:hypothetical protein [Campylobacterota bacterium]
MCFIVTLVMAYFSIANFIAGNITAGVLQGSIALFFLLLLIRNVYVTIQERKGCSVSGCKITESIANLFRKKN